MSKAASKAASENELSVLHKAVAQYMTLQLQTKDADGNPVPISASDVSNILKFLKDNAITCAADDDNHMGALERELMERAGKTAANSEPVPADLADALDRAGKMH